MLFTGYDMARDIPRFAARVRVIACSSDWLEHDSSLVVSFGAHPFREKGERRGRRGETLITCNFGVLFDVVIKKPIHVDH